MLAALLISQILWHPTCHFQDIMNEGLFQRRGSFFCFECESAEPCSSCSLLCQKKTWSLSAEALIAGEPCFNAVDGVLAWIRWWRIRCCGVRWDWALDRANPCVREVFWGSPEVLWTHFGVVAASETHTVPFIRKSWCKVKWGHGEIDQSAMQILVSRFIWRCTWIFLWTHFCVTASKKRKGLSFF